MLLTCVEGVWRERSRMEVADEGVKTEAVEAKPAVSNEMYERSELPNLLRVYYAWLFPYDKYFQWLNYGITSCLMHLLCSTS